MRALAHGKMVVRTTASVASLHDATSRKGQYVWLQISARQQRSALGIFTPPHKLMSMQTLSILASSITSLNCLMQHVCIPHFGCNGAARSSMGFSRTFCGSSEHSECVAEQLNPLQCLLHSRLRASAVCKEAHAQRTACIAHLATCSGSLSIADSGLRQKLHLHYQPLRYPSPESDTAQQQRNRTLCSTKSWLMPSLELKRNRLAS